jgi:hypothetical protein
MAIPNYFDPSQDIEDTERRRRESCLSKATYATKALAEAAAVAAEYQGGMAASGLSAYVCRYCAKWHLSRRGL